jgi:hypothetical protein
MRSSSPSPKTPKPPPPPLNTLRWSRSTPPHPVVMVSELLAHGADVHQVRSTDGGTPLHGCAWNGHVEVVNALLKAGANPSPTTRNDGTTPLMAAANEGHLAVVEVRRVVCACTCNSNPNPKSGCVRVYLCFASPLSLPLHSQNNFLFRARALSLFIL